MKPLRQVSFNIGGKDKWPDGPHKESYLGHNPFSVDKGFMLNVPVYLTDLEQRI
jgi:hypothetical protein